MLGVPSTFPPVSPYNLIVLVWIEFPYELITGFIISEVDVSEEYDKLPDTKFLSVS